MTRVQILLTEEQDRKLEALAHALRTSKAWLVREGVDIVLRRKIPGRSDPLLELVGRAGRVGRSDISAAHRHHRSAGETFPNLLGKFQTLVTTNHVIGETYTLRRTAKGYREARAFTETLDRNLRLERYFVTQELERETVALLHRYAEHPFSFVDGTSFTVMRRERIQHAFAFDSYFSTAGFIRLPARGAAETRRNR